MSDFNDFIQYRALALKFERENQELTDAVISSGDEPIPLRNVCAKLTVELSDRIDATVALLRISKRVFIERALIEAMDKADAAIAAVGALDHLEKAE